MLNLIKLELIAQHYCAIPPVRPNRPDRSVPNIERIFPFLVSLYSTPFPSIPEPNARMVPFHSTWFWNRTHPYSKRGNPEINNYSTGKGSCGWLADGVIGLQNRSKRTSLKDRHGTADGDWCAKGQETTPVPVVWTSASATIYTCRSMYVWNGSQ